jgi:HEAT repeat protein
MKFTATFLLVGLFALSSANAQEKTYGGRVFDDWKVLVANDLDPETRRKAMTAIGVLGHHSHRADAIESLQRAIASESHPTVVRAGYAAILTFGDDAIPLIEASLRAKDEGERRRALHALSVFFSPTRYIAVKNVRAVALPKKIVPPFLAILQDSEGNIRDRVTAARTLRGIFRTYDPGEFAEKALPTLMQLAKSPNTELASEALRTIGRLGKHAAPAVPMLISYVEKEEKPQRSSDRQRVVSRQMAAIAALGYLGPVAKKAVPALEKLQQRRGSLSAGIAKRALTLIRREADDN